MKIYHFSAPLVKGIRNAKSSVICLNFGCLKAFFCQLATVHK